MATIASSKYVCGSPFYACGRRKASSQLRWTPLSPSPSPSPAGATWVSIRASQQDPPSSSSVDVSVFRFTLGIPGFDDSDLPRVLGIAFGAVLVLNHFLGADYVTAAQWRSELVGLCNSILSISLPSIGRSLSGGRPDAATLLPNSRQIFALSKNLLLEEKEELAWGSYALLKNTRTTSLVIWNEELLCARGFWDVPSEAEGDVIGWLEEMVKKSSVSTCNTLTYIPFKADKLAWDFIPSGVVCSLVVPFDSSSVEEITKCHAIVTFHLVFWGVKEIPQNVNGICKGLMCRLQLNREGLPIN
ncbi:hypothetical protein GOP47_0012623 [Adiantum capillus-veneris]|uniref:Uncharacterized protein n=1 Tax=Adiantum capillus-veneris TaxID=13818 RepID=A0A9D4ZFV9_ADICA|nr:hypothetical protein GOP47_0012623 [Adiantum capillus-veneris]